jgi:hypothetical protein
MILITLISAACGAVLGRWLRILVLIPASLVAWCVALVFAWTQNFSLLQGMAMALLAATCLQFGYLGSAALAGAQNAFRKRRRIMTVH